MNMTPYELCLQGAEFEEWMGANAQGSAAADYVAESRQRYNKIMDMALDMTIAEAEAW